MSSSRSLWRTLVWSTPLAAFGLPTSTASLSRADIYDAPGTYYSTAYTLSVPQTGATLKVSLNNIIDGNNSVSYDNARKALQVTDGVIGSANLMFEFYDNTQLDLSTINPSGTNSGANIKGWDSGVTWNREHTWPQSRGADTGAVESDLHMLRPADSGNNSSRGNKSYGGTGTLPGASGVYYYPGNIHKGDAARGAFYADTRYDGVDAGGPDLQLVDGNPAAYLNQMGNKADVVRFSYEDVPDQWERKRNDAIYSSTNWFNTPNRAAAVGITSSNVGTYVQGNRNPFIDHPEWVWSIFMDQANDARLTLSGGTTNATTGASTLSLNLGRKMVGQGGTFSQAVTITKSGADYTYFNVSATGSASSTLIGQYNAFTDAGTRATTVSLPATGSAGLVSGTVTVDNLDITTGGGAGNGANDGNDVITANAALVNNRTLTATTVSLGRVITGNTVTGTATITSPTGQDNSLTRVTLGAGTASGATASGTFTLQSGTAYQFGNANDATNSTSRGVSLAVTSTTQGPSNGGFSTSPTAEGLTGESVQSFAVNYTATVLSHSNASFSLSSDVNSLTGGTKLDFGIVAQGAGLTTLPFSVANLVTGSALYTAGLDLDSFSGTGSASSLTTNLPTSFANLLAGNANAYTVALNTSALGTFTATYTLLLSDENIAGQANSGNQSISFTATGIVDVRQWIASGSGAWSNSGAWLGSVPNGVDQPANFLSKITATANVNLDGSRTVGSVTFADADGYTIGRSDGTSALTLQSTTAAAITVSTGSHTIAVPVTLASNTTIDTALSTQLTSSAGLSSGASISLVKQGAGTLAITGGATLAGPVTISAGLVSLGGTVTTGDVVNHGTLSVANNTTVGLLMGTGATTLDPASTLTTKGVRQDAVTIGAGGVLTVVQQSGRTTSLIKTLAIAGGATPTAKLDLGDNLLVIDYGVTNPKATIAAQIKVGRGTTNLDGLYAFDGQGITSSIAGAQNALSGFNQFVVAGIDNADYVAINGVGYTSFGGLTIDASAVLVRYTFAGDANLDGAITAADYTLINDGFAGTIANYGWLSGDFNLDGTINADDYAIIDFGAIVSAGTALGSGTPVAVPEPVSLSIIVLASAGLMSRRRRVQK